MCIRDSSMGDPISPWRGGRGFLAACRWAFGVCPSFPSRLFGGPVFLRSSATIPFFAPFGRDHGARGSGPLLLGKPSRGHSDCPPFLRRFSPFLGGKPAAPPPLGKTALLNEGGEKSDQKPKEKSQSCSAQGNETRAAPAHLFAQRGYCCQTRHEE